MVGADPNGGGEAQMGDVVLGIERGGEIEACSGDIRGDVDVPVCAGSDAVCAAEGWKGAGGAV
jgi:hypothetical protein